MKGLFKFIPVAVGLIALTSCNSEDYFGGDYTVKKATLEVTVEDMGEGTTRTAYTAKNKRTWQETDYFTVYDNELHKYDYYKYNATSDAFELDGQKDLTAPAFVAFPKESVVTTYWEKDTRSTSLDMGIPAEWNFAELAQEDGTAAYLSQLPMWGKAEADGESIKAKNVQFLTSYIKITIDNALNNVKAVRITAFEDIAGKTAKNISGIANAPLSENGEVLSVTQLASPEKGSSEFTLGNIITVNLQDSKTNEKYVKTGTSCIFIPLIAGHYGKVIAEYQDATDAWQTLKIWTDQTFERGGLPYGASKNDFKASGKDIPQLNAAIATLASKTGDVNVIVDDATTDVQGVAKNTETFLNTIVLPNMACDKVTITVPDFKGDKAGRRLWLTGDEFTKTVVLNPAALTNIDGGVYVELPNANVVLAGDYTTAVVTIKAAKSVTYGVSGVTSMFGNQNITVEVPGTETLPAFTVAKDATVGTFTTIAECGNIEVKAGGTIGDITLPADHRANSVKIAGTAGDITVPASVIAAAKPTNIEVSGESGHIVATADGEAATNVTVSGKSNYIYVKGAKNTGNIVVSGVCTSEVKTWGTGTITVSGVAKVVTTVNENAGLVEISGAPNYKTAKDNGFTGTDYAKVHQVNTLGNVTINLNNEGAAIGSSLTMAAGKTLTLTQGYVKAIVASDDTKNPTNIVFDESGKYINIGAISSGNVALSGVTKWNGEAFGGSIDKKAEWEAAGLTSDPSAVRTAWAAYKNDGSAVYTAMDLQANKGAFTLVNDIDLNNKAWTPVATTDAINGNGFTISNLKVAVPADGDDAAAATAGLGLFSDLKHNVSNLTLDGVKINAVKYTTSKKDYVVDNIGAIAGVASAAATLTKVTVKNINLSSTGGAKNIGGIVGTNTAALTLKGVKVTGTNTIKGYYQMGGLVGYAAENVTVSTFGSGKSEVVSSAAVSFTANHNSATTNPALDKQYLSVGNFIGAALNTKTVEITCEAADVNATLNSDYSIFTNAGGYVKHNVGVNFYDYVFGQTLIGWSGDTDFTTAPKINSKNYQLYANKAAYDAVKGTTPTYLYYINM